LILEHPNRFTSLEKLIRLLVINREIIRIKVNSFGIFYEFNRIFYQSKGLQTQEVHFQKSGTFCNRVIELRDIQHRLIFSRSNRNEIRNIIRSNDYPTSVNSGVSK